MINKEIETKAEGGLGMVPSPYMGNSEAGTAFNMACSVAPPPLINVPVITDGFPVVRVVISKNALPKLKKGITENTKLISKQYMQI